MIYFELALYAEIIMTCFKSKSTHSEYLLRIIRPHIKKQKSQLMLRYSYRDTDGFDGLPEK